MSKNVCDNQSNFNTAFEKAVKYVEKKHEPNKTVQIISVGLTILVITIALLMASTTSGDKKVHYVLALIFSPFYIIASLINNMK